MAAKPKRAVSAKKKTATATKKAATKKRAARTGARSIPKATLAQVRRALGGAGLAGTSVDLDALPKPYALAVSDVTLDELREVKGTTVVVGDLHVKGDIALRRSKGIPALVVTGDVIARHVYADATLVVGGTLAALTVVGDAGWDGGFFVGGLDADTLVLKETALETLGRGPKDRVRVRRLADLEKPAKAKKAVPELFELDPDDVPAYAYFLTLPR